MEKGEDILVLPFRKGELEGFVELFLILIYTITCFPLPSAGELFILVYKTGYSTSVFHK